MAMADEYVYTISSLYLQKWLSYDIKHVKNRYVSTFHVISGLAAIFRILFLTDFDASKSVLRSFFAFPAKIWPKKHASQL